MGYWFIMLNGQEQPSACMTTPITWQENLVWQLSPDGQLLSSYLTTSLSQYLKAQGGDVFLEQVISRHSMIQMNLPNFVWYNSDSTTRKVNLALNNITEDTSIGITFDYIDDFATGIKDITSFSF